MTDSQLATLAMTSKGATIYNHIFILFIYVHTSTYSSQWLVLPKLLLSSLPVLSLLMLSLVSCERIVSKHCFLTYIANNFLTFAILPNINSFQHAQTKPCYFENG